MSNDELFELCRAIGLISGGTLAFSLVRVTTLRRIFAMALGASLAVAMWVFSAAFLFGKFPSLESDWFWAAIVVQCGMALTAGGMGAYLFKRGRNA